MQKLEDCANTSGGGPKTLVVLIRRNKLLLNKLDELDKKAELTQLEAHELDLKHVRNERLAELLREEELKWYQRSKVKNF